MGIYSFETTQEDRAFGNSRCRGVAYDENQRLTAVIEMETEPNSGVYDAYIISFKDENFSTSGVNVQAQNFNGNL